ncbi:phosphoenolpyruvate carboxykinase [Tepiditoga spiralis]|uniref:Phosphoenolpyruvate carboxykinase (ATP) n=1 Tax=Tepiditoga spiralis TaxID=2108365 RepID=A0A7G1G956_9BACT|nr:phosphoenolpyruvate carboxykinase (ATP) [Tepiditoga spiralis]BBE31986.1 phosphoenolpyruvate carboxykinase [Tepiditoga spiralis]
MLSTKIVHVNSSRAYLIEQAIKKGEAKLLSNGTINTITEPYTGRSPRDKFVVIDEITKDKINWNSINQPFSKYKYVDLRNDLKEHIENTEEIYIENGYAGAEERYKLKVKIITTSPIQALTFKNLVINAKEDFKESDMNIYSSPEFSADKKLHGTNSDAFIILNPTDHEVIIGKTRYAGEIKKSIFSYMNYFLPLHGIFSMHCSANTDLNGENPALFFGLSGTGKTTLSLDENRLMVGDDEHGWHDEGIFNIEGGSYAKIIGVSEDNGKEIYDTLKFGVFTENVVHSDKRLPDYLDSSITENTRASIPLSFFGNTVKKDGIAGHPKTIFFLSADAFGILPPISELNEDQIFKYFMLGYTAKLAGTERGVKNPTATFSEGFAKPFLPLKPEVYGKMLVKMVKKHGSKVFLVNTGWIGGPYGIGSRIKLRYTKRLVDAAINNEFEEFEVFEPLNLKIPTNCKEVPSNILNPRNTWENPEEYDASANKLYTIFKKNFV